MNALAATIEEDAGEAPFHTARAALLFALTREGNPPRPAAARMADRTLTKRDFIGLDGAAQAGMILATVRSCGRAESAAMIAAVAFRTVPCHCRRTCCSGHKANTDWVRAIDTLAQEVASFLPRTTYELRTRVLLKIHGSGETNLEIADALAVDRDTISKYHNIMRRWLNGAAAGRGGESSIEGVLHAGWREAETLFRARGIVRDP